MPANLSVLLNVNDVEKSERFYNEIGFRTTRTREDRMDYVEARMGSALISLFPKDAPTADSETRRWLANPLGTGVVINLETPGIDSFYKKVRGAGAEIEMPLAEQEWGTRGFMFNDPDGYVFFVGAPSRASRSTTRTAKRKSSTRSARRTTSRRSANERGRR